MSSYTLQKFSVEKYGSSALKCRVGRLHTILSNCFTFKSRIYMKMHQNVAWSNISGYPARLSTSYIAPKCNQRGGLLLYTAVLALFFVYKTFPSPQKVSGSYKNSYRKLRVCTFKSKNLVNGCWPFRQHIHRLFNRIAVKSLIATLRKVILEVYKVRQVRIRDIRLVYYRSWHL